MRIQPIVEKILYEFDLYNTYELQEMIKSLPLKIIRWLVRSHPDNRMRKLLLRFSNVEVGEGSVVNINFVVSDDYKQLLRIGKRVAISPNVTIVCCSAPNNSNLVNDDYVKEKLIVEKEVNIGNDVWIGSNVVIMPGVTIGESSIIGAGSIVTKSVDPFSIYAGVPAKKTRNLK